MWFASERFIPYAAEKSTHTLESLFDEFENKKNRGTKKKHY